MDMGFCLIREFRNKHFLSPISYLVDGLGVLLAICWVVAYVSREGNWTFPDVFSMFRLRYSIQDCYQAKHNGNILLSSCLQWGHLHGDRFQLMQQLVCSRELYDFNPFVYICIKASLKDNQNITNKYSSNILYNS